MGEFFFIAFAIALGIFVSDMAHAVLRGVHNYLALRKLQRLQNELMNSLGAAFPQGSPLVRDPYFDKLDPKKFN